MKNNCKLFNVPSGIVNAAQPHALNITPSRGTYYLEMADETGNIHFRSLIAKE